MVRNETVVDVFISAPGDLDPEVSAIVGAIEQWNRTSSKMLGIRLNPINWRSDTFPDASTDPQQVINEQIGQDYDIYIGILWHRFGTPTGRANSGTEEEFERALAKHNEDPSMVKVMIYFKTEPIPLTIDTEQLKKVQDFKSGLSQKGVLYHEFSTQEELEKIVQVHLSRQIQNLRKDTSHATTPRTENDQHKVKQKPDTWKEIQIEAEEGFLDLVERGINSFTRMSNSSQGLLPALDEWRNETNQTTQELRELKADDKLDPKRAKEILRRSAAATQKLGDALESYIPEFRDAYSDAMDSYGKATALLIDFDSDSTEQIDDAIEGLKSLRETLIIQLESVSQFRQVLEDTPRITTEHNRAQKRTIPLLQELEKEIKIAINSSTEVEQSMQHTASQISRQIGSPTVEQED